MQTPQLRDDQEQEENYREAGVQQVLPMVSQAYQPQGNAVARPASKRRGDNREQLQKAEAIPD
jgi:hypothetical protein